MRLMQYGSLESRFAALWQDGLAASVIFLLGIPLSIGAALASGAPPQSGLIAAAMGGLVCGTLLGSPMLVTGPVVALAVMLHQVIAQYGFVAMCVVTVMAGLLQVSLGLLRLGRHALAVNTAILEGMLAGVGLTLMMSQIQVILVGRAQKSAWANLVTLPESIAHGRPTEAAVGVATILLVLLWERLPWKRYVPAVLVAIALVTGALAIFDVPHVQRVNMPQHSTWQLLDLHQGWAMAMANWRSLGWASLELGLICSIYSLLSAVAVDGLHKGPRTHLNRELAVQGLANVASGVLGGLPVSGAVLRSTANINAGATSRWSITLQGALMLLALTRGSAILQQLPTACLATFFAYLGWALLRVKRMIFFWHKGSLPLYVAALVGSVVANLLVGVLCGILVNVVLLCASVLRLRVTVQGDQRLWRVHLEGVASFLGVATLTRALSNIPPKREVQIVNHATYTDTTITAALVRYCEGYDRLGGKASLAKNDI